MLINIAIFTVGAFVGVAITLGLAALGHQLDHDADQMDVERL
jgi:hypothetical protein